MDPVSSDLLKWYDANRRVLPWRENPNVYWVWISEVMLQQTRVDTGLQYFGRFIERFPTVQHLAEAPLDDVLTLWSGLGYYSRARNLHKAAQMVADVGEFPRDLKGLRELPGVGEYMAAAIASIALGLDEATVDGNIARVMARLHADLGPRKAMWGHARTHLPKGRAGDYNQALMDLGATVCTPRGPKCDGCPVRSHCSGLRTGTPTQFPAAKAKKRVPTVPMNLTVYVQRDAVWVGRRPASGLWAGLWAFPEAKDADGRQIGGFEHVLSHKRLAVNVWVSEGPPPAPDPDWSGFAWVRPVELENRGISALTAKCLKLFQDERPSRGDNHSLA